MVEERAEQRMDVRHKEQVGNDLSQKERRGSWGTGRGWSSRGYRTSTGYKDRIQDKYLKNLNMSTFPRYRPRGPLKVNHRLRSGIFGGVLAGTVAFGVAQEYFGWFKFLDPRPADEPADLVINTQERDLSAWQELTDKYGLLPVQTRRSQAKELFEERAAVGLKKYIQDPSLEEGGGVTLLDKEIQPDKLIVFTSSKKNTNASIANGEEAKISDQKIESIEGNSSTDHS